MADVEVALRWTGDGLRFEGGPPGGPTLRIDGDGRDAPSPMQTLLLALAACTGADTVDILTKMRVPLEGLEVQVEGDRAAEAPRRYVRVRMLYAATGLAPSDEAKLRRAVSLSHETYCSALHTFAPDVEFHTEIQLR